MILKINFSSPQSAISCVLVVMGDIENLIGGFSAAMWLFYGMVFLGLVIMRSSHREQRRPFKVRNNYRSGRNIIIQQ